MPGEDDVVILGKPTLKPLGIDVSDSLGARARERAALTAVDTAAYRQCRRVTVSTDAVQQQTSFTPKEPNEAVERLVARGPEIDMSPEEELRARSEALKGAVQAEAAAGVQDSQVQRLREVIGSRWNAFRRGLRRDDPPARVEPLRRWSSVGQGEAARLQSHQDRLAGSVHIFDGGSGACFPQYAGRVGQCSHGYATKRWVSHIERLSGCQPASREGAGCDAQSRSEHGQAEWG